MKEFIPRKLLSLLLAAALALCVPAVSAAEGGDSSDAAAGRNPIVHEDMSISWDYPENMLGADGLEIVSLDENGEKIGSTTLSNIKNELDTRTVMSELYYLAPKKAAKFLINYKPLSGAAESMEVDVSGITLQN